MKRRIALLGTSLQIDSLAAALAGIPGLELLRGEYSTAEDLTKLQALMPDAVVFDMAEMPGQPFLDLLRRSGLSLVGCDLAIQQMLLLSSKSVRLATMDDLLRVLSAQGAQHKNKVGQTLG